MCSIKEIVSPDYIDWPESGSIGKVLISKAADGHK